MKRIAGKTSLMVEYELRMFRSNLELNIRKPSYVLSHTAVVSTCLFVGVSLALAPQYFLLEGYSQFLFESEAIVYDILTALFVLLLLYTLIRSLFGQGVRSYVSEADADILAYTPIESRSVIMAKAVRSLISRLSLTIYALFIFTPIALSLKTPPILLAAALMSLTLYVEFLQAASYAIQAVTDVFRSRLSSRAGRFFKIVAVTVSAVVPLVIVLDSYYGVVPWTTTLREGIEAFWSLLPSSLTASLILNFMLGRTEGALPSLLSLSLLLAGGLAVMYAALGPCHPEELTPQPFPSSLRNPLGYRLGRFLESRFAWERPSLIIFMKDLHLALRGALIDFSVLNFTAMYVISLASWYLLESLMPLEVIPEFEARLGPLRAFVKELVIILALLPFIPSLTSFSRELRKIWVLKIFPFKDHAVAYGKFFFALTISAASLAPLVLAAGLAFKVTSSEWIMGAALPLILVIANSFGVLVGAYLPPYDLGNQMSLKSISTFFIFLIVVLAPFAYVSSARNNLETALILGILALYTAASATFFLKKAGKGIRKLELRRTLP